MKAHDDPKVKCTAKAPTNWTLTYRDRLSVYRDAYAMCWCMAYASPLCRAYYGMTASEMCDAHLGN